jgi:hypothetical protein
LKVVAYQFFSPLVVENELVHVVTDISEEIFGLGEAGSVFDERFGLGEEVVVFLVVEDDGAAVLG